MRREPKDFPQSFPNVLSLSVDRVRVEVEFDYDAELEDELTIRAGQILTGVKRMKGGWWEGELEGKRGLFPDNFVKVGN